MAVTKTAVGVAERRREKDSRLPAHRNDVRSEDTGGVRSWLSDKAQDALIWWYIVTGYREGRKKQREKIHEVPTVPEEAADDVGEGEQRSR